MIAKLNKLEESGKRGVVFSPNEGGATETSRECYCCGEISHFARVCSKPPPVKKDTPHESSN